MEIVQQVTAPQAAIDLIMEEYEIAPFLEKVIIVGGTDQIEGRMSVYVIDTHSIIIDLEACMMNTQWMEKGMSFVNNAWCNLIYCIFHEGAHIAQCLEHEEDLDGMDEAILEHAADIEALEKMIGWFKINAKSPSLSELGWLGDQVRGMFNKIYTKLPDLIGIEVDLLGTEAGGLAAIAAHNPYFESTQKAAEMIKAVDDGLIGVKVKGHSCLKIEDILEIATNKNRS